MVATYTKWLDGLMATYTKWLDGSLLWLFLYKITQIFRLVAINNVLSYKVIC